MSGFSRAKTYKPRTIERQAEFFVSVFIMPLVIILILICSIITYRTSRNALDIKEKNFSYYTNELENSLSSVSIFLSKTADDNFQLMSQINNQESKDREIPIRSLYLRLKEDISYYPNVMYMFVAADDNIYMASSPYNNSSGNLSYGKVKRIVSDYLRDSSIDTRWKLIADEAEQKNYLLRVFQFDNIYLGACFNTDVFQNLYRDKYSGGQQHAVLNFDVTKESVVFKSVESDRSYWKPFLRHTSEKAIKDSSIGIVYTIDFSSILLIPVMIFIFCIIISLFIFVSKQYLRKNIVEPMNSLVLYMDGIKSGQKPNIPFPENLPNYELSLFSSTFNEMMDEMTLLNRQLLDEQKRQSLLEMQCLRLQLNPHFFLNCLNHIFLLSRNNRNEELQALTRSFTAYFRSVFQFDTDTITLDEELTRCSNYAEVYKIRSYKDFELHISCEDEYADCLIPHMCIQTFIENSIKYATDDLNELKINVEISRVEDDVESEKLVISIADNGFGFDEDALNAIKKDLTDNNRFVDGGHIGIRNLAQRMYYLYGDDRYSLSITNSPNRGSLVVVKIPFEKKKEIPFGEVESVDSIDS